MFRKKITYVIIVIVLIIAALIYMYGGYSKEGATSVKGLMQVAGLFDSLKDAATPWDSDSSFNPKNIADKLQEYTKKVGEKSVDAFHDAADDVKDIKDSKEKLRKARKEIATLREACGSKCDSITETQPKVSGVSADGKKYTLTMIKKDGSRFECKKGDTLDITKKSSRLCSGTGCVAGIQIYDTTSGEVKKSKEADKNGAILVGDKDSYIDATLHCIKTSVKNLTDLSLVSVSTPNNIPLTATSIDIARTYKVTGNDATSTIVISYRLSRNDKWGDADDIILSDVEELTSSADRAIGNHVAIRTQRLVGRSDNKAWTTKAGAGRYYIMARIANRTAAESSDDNNVFVGNTLTIGGVDLRRAVEETTSTVGASTTKVTTYALRKKLINNSTWQCNAGDVRDLTKADDTLNCTGAGCVRGVVVHSVTGNKKVNDATNMRDAQNNVDLRGLKLNVTNAPKDTYIDATIYCKKTETR